jgi:hypothetical protein
LDAIDKVIWVCPFLSLLDVTSTFYIRSQGYLLEVYERGFFASLSVAAGSVYVYVYAVIYLLIMVGIAYVLWYIKKRELQPSRIFDKVFFLAVIGVVFYIYMRLTATFLVNFLLPTIIERGINVFSLTLVIYGTSAFSLTIYLFQPILSWVSRGDDKKDK